MYDELEPSVRRDLERIKLANLLDERNGVVYGEDGTHKGGKDI